MGGTMQNSIWSGSLTAKGAAAVRASADKSQLGWAHGRGRRCGRRSRVRACLRFRLIRLVTASLYVALLRPHCWRLRRRKAAHGGGFNAPSVRRCARRAPEREECCREGRASAHASRTICWWRAQRRPVEPGCRFSNAEFGRTGLGTSLHYCSLRRRTDPLQI